MRICLLIAGLLISPAFLVAAENADYRLPAGITHRRRSNSGWTRQRRIIPARRLSG
jgi:hypothetical protein